MQIAKRLVLIFGASPAKIAEQFVDSVAGLARHAGDSADGISLDKSGQNSRPFIGAQLIHVTIMLRRLSIVNKFLR